MTGMFRGGSAARMVLLLLAAGACGYDHPTDTTGPGYGNDTGGVSQSAASGRQVFAASGDLTEALAAFRAVLGGGVNLLPGEQASGRREINWDGVAAALVNVDTFPGDFFNRVVPRGQLFSTEGSGFRVSDNALSDLNPAYGAEFAAFSPPKIFIPVGRQTMTVRFVVAGAGTPARVNGFGVVFSDVDVEAGAGLAFFNARGELLARVSAPVRSDRAGFSFVGVSFNAPIVASVRIQSGRSAITGRNADISAGGDADLVAMDDFISGEPHATP